MKKDKDYWTIVVDSKKSPSIEISSISNSEVEKKVSEIVSAVCKKMQSVQVVFKENARYRVYGGGWYTEVSKYTHAMKQREHLWEMGIEDVKIEEI